jgi:hypothetical protein
MMLGMVKIGQLDAELRAFEKRRSKGGPEWERVKLEYGIPHKKLEIPGGFWKPLERERAKESLKENPRDQETEKCDRSRTFPCGSATSESK